MHYKKEAIKMQRQQVLETARCSSQRLRVNLFSHTSAHTFALFERSLILESLGHGGDGNGVGVSARHAGDGLVPMRELRRGVNVRSRSASQAWQPAEVLRSRERQDSRPEWPEWGLRDHMPAERYYVRSARAEHAGLSTRNVTSGVFSMPAAWVMLNMLTIS